MNGIIDMRSHLSLFAEDTPARRAAKRGVSGESIKRKDIPMSPAMRRIFWFVNKYFMVPIFRLGFGPFFGNPYSGYIMVMKVIGRISGKTYFVPVNYAIWEGSVYCISGGRRTSDWFKNLMAK